MFTKRRLIVTAAAISSVAAISLGVTGAQGAPEKPGSDGSGVTAVLSQGNVAPTAALAADLRGLEAYPQGKPTPIAFDRISGFRSSRGLGAVGSGKTADGVEYTCIQLPLGAGGCAEDSTLETSGPMGGVTAVEGGFEIVTLLPSGSSAPSITTDSGKTTELSLDANVASGVFAASNGHSQTLTWRGADGKAHAHDVVTP